MSGDPRGLPGALPAGEVLLWQGAPDWRILARRGLHLRKLVLYFAVIAAAVAVFAVQRGDSPADVALGAGRALLVGAIPIVLLLAYAWGVARTTVYTVTNRRVAMRFGIVIPLTVNLPFTRLVSAAVLAHADGSGDIALVPSGPSELAYFLLWPHARPWRLARPNPTLRGLRDATGPARILGRALAAAAGQPSPVIVAPPEAVATPARSPIPA